MTERCRMCGAVLIETTVTELCSDPYCENGNWYGKSFNDPNPSECPTCNGTGKESLIKAICPICTGNSGEFA